MTSYVSGFTIPSAVLQHPAAYILLSVLGTAVGFGTRPPDASQKLLRCKRHNFALKQPPLQPPPWAFGSVWTLLYGLMGYASYRVATAGLSPFAPPQIAESARNSLALYTVQLGLNLAWMPLFFVAKRPVEATIDIVTLLGVNGYLAYVWASIDLVAGLCQLPYLGWLSFATYLCAGAGYLNNWNLVAKEVEPSAKND